MPKIVHAADFHLDSAFGGLPTEKARERRRESRELTGRLARLVLEEGAEVLLLSGDLFDGERVFPETLEQLGDVLASLPCPVFIAPGNHDPYTAISPYALRRWPENVHIFRSEELEAVVLPDLNCVVHGAAFTSRGRTDQVLAGFAAPRDGRTHLLCLHGDVGAPGSAYGPVLREQLAASGLHYAALGHIHQYSGVQRDGNTCWAYPGCPEGRGFDELGDKGVLSGTADREGVSLRFIPLCRRRYRILEADVTEASPREALEAVLPETADQDICRIIFTGEADERGVDLPALESAFRERFYALELRDRTRPAQSLWARAGEDSLRGLFLQEMKGRYDAAPSGEAREEIALAVRFGLAALDGRDIG